jgi:hypothetical protein
MMNRTSMLLVALTAVVAAAVILAAVDDGSSPTAAQAARVGFSLASGPEVRGIAPTSCPYSSPWNDDGTTSQPKSGRPGSAKTLVPGTPVSALICVYNGLPEPRIRTAGFGLIGERTLSAAGTTQLAQAFNALKPFPSGAVSCPSDDAAGATVYFRYETGSDALVSVSMSGCTSSSNGYLTRLSYPSILGGVRGSTAFILAHEATVRGRVCDSAFRPRCVVPKLEHLSVELRSGRLWTSDPAVRAGLFTGHTTPGRITVTVVHNFLSPHPISLATARRSVSAGHAVAVTFWVR